MTIFNNSENFRIFDLANSHDDLYFADLNASAHAYCSSIVIIDLANAMRPGKTCTRWLFSVSRDAFPVVFVGKDFPFGAYPFATISAQSCRVSEFSLGYLLVRPPSAVLDRLPQTASQSSAHIGSRNCIFVDCAVSLSPMLACTAHLQTIRIVGIATLCIG